MEAKAQSAEKAMQRQLQEQQLKRQYQQKKHQQQQQRLCIGDIIGTRYNLLWGAIFCPYILGTTSCFHHETTREVDNFVPYENSSWLYRETECVLHRNYYCETKSQSLYLCVLF